MFEPGRALGLENWGNIVLEPIGDHRTRLMVRGRIPAGTHSLVYAALMELPHFIMERGMLLGIKRRAEDAASRTPPANQPDRSRQAPTRSAPVQRRDSPVRSRYHTD